MSPFLALMITYQSPTGPPGRDFSTHQTVVLETAGFTPAQLAAAYPASAARMTEQGFAEVKCDIEVDASTRDCAVVSEQPKGFGIGAAAVSLALTMRAPISRPTSIPAGVKFSMTLPPFFFIPAGTVEGRTEPSTVSMTPAPIVEPDARSDDVQLSWKTEPDAAQIAAALPPSAKDRGRGRAFLTCLANADGSLARCRVAFESPVEMGFGAAALGLAPDFMLKPPLASNGGPVSGLTVLVPVEWDPEAPRPPGDPSVIR